MRAKSGNEHFNFGNIRCGQILLYELKRNFNRIYKKKICDSVFEMQKVS